MNKSIAILLSAVFAACSSSAVLADDIVAVYTCKLKEGKTQDELQAANSKWLGWIHEKVNKDIRSAVGTAVVGKQGMFVFADTYPDLATWAAAQEALDSDMGGELENLFSDISECSENSLYRFEATQ